MTIEKRKRKGDLWVPLVLLLVIGGLIVFYLCGDYKWGQCNKVTVLDKSVVQGKITQALALDTPVKTECDCTKKKRTHKRVQQKTKHHVYRVQKERKAIPTVIVTEPSIPTIIVRKVPEGTIEKPSVPTTQQKPQWLLDGVDTDTRVATKQEGGQRRVHVIHQVILPRDPYCCGNAGDTYAVTQPVFIPTPSTFVAAAPVITPAPSRETPAPSRFTHHGPSVTTN